MRTCVEEIVKMSAPQDSDNVKLITSIFSPRKELVDKVIKELEGKFGPRDWTSPEMFFDRTKYYQREMGWPLHRRFITFRDLIRPEEIVDIKLATNDIERQYLIDGNREVNIDPGYISLERLILATGKNYTHRVYLSKGIYADLTLIFNKGGFRTLEWTYRDYSEPETIGFLNELRERYKRQLRGLNEYDEH